MSMFSMAAVGEGMGFFYVTAIISLGMFIFGFRLVHIWARGWKAKRISEIQSTKGPEAVKYLYPKMAILPGGLWRWIVVPVISILLLYTAGQISLAQREDYAYLLVLLFLLDGVYCACVRMPHYFLVDGISFLFAAGYMAHAAFTYFFPGHPAGLRIFSIVTLLLLLHGSLSIWGFWKIRRKRTLFT
ncbi:MAG: hypothetical protein ISS26_00015 [Candidatus Omnitrophica bacterium]|nr:hypothetical protein [Candidatus Omnitrophota bacterium]